MKKLLCLVMAFVLVSAMVVPSSAGFVAEQPSVSSLSTSEMVYAVSEAGIELSNNSKLEQINYITSDGSIGGAIVVTTVEDDLVITDLVVPYVYEPSEKRVVNAITRGYGYTTSSSSKTYIYVSARYYHYYTTHPTQYFTLVRPDKIAASYTVTDSSFSIFSMTVTCASIGEVYTSNNYSLYANSYTHTMSFYKANPVANTYYESAASQAMSSSYWMHFIGSSYLTGQGAFYTIAYSGYLNGTFISINDGIALPIYVA